MLENVLKIWNRLPSVVRLILLVITVPNMILAIVVFNLWFIPWHDTRIEARMKSSEERYFQEMRVLEVRQTLHLQKIDENIKTLNQHQAIMLETMLKQRGRK